MAIGLLAKESCQLLVSPMSLGTLTPGPNIRTLCPACWIGAGRYQEWWIVVERTHGWRWPHSLGVIAGKIGTATFGQVVGVSEGFFIYPRVTRDILDWVVESVIHNVVWTLTDFGSSGDCLAGTGRGSLRTSHPELQPQTGPDRGRSAIENERLWLQT